MKKFIILGLALATSLFATAQEEPTEEVTDIVTEGARDVPMTKKGKVITPQAGDIGLTIDAIPFIDYVSGITNINGSSNTTPNSPAFNSIGGNLTVVGRYFLDDQTAVRVNFGLTSVKTGTQEVVDDLSTTDPEASVLDKTSNTDFNLTIGGGLEKRRGYGRLQGFYGAQASISYSNDYFKQDLGNELQDIFVANGSVAPAVEIESQTTGGVLDVVIEGVVGVEYFFARKMSVGGQFTWGPTINILRVSGKEDRREFDANGEAEIEDQPILGTQNRDPNGIILNASGDLFLSFFF